VRARVADLVTVAARMTGMREEALYGAIRCRRFSAVRSAIYTIAREHRYSYPAIGRAMAGRDHSSIIAVYRGLDRYSVIYPQLPAFVDALRENVVSAGSFVSDTGWQPTVCFAFAPSDEEHRWHEAWPLDVAA